LRRCARAWCHVRGPLAPRARARDVVNLRSSGGVIATHRYPVRRGRYGRTRSVSQRDLSRKRETSAISGIMASPNCDRNRAISSPPSPSPTAIRFVIRKQADSFYMIHFSALYSLYGRYKLVNDNNGTLTRARARARRKRSCRAAYPLETLAQLTSELNGVEGKLPPTVSSRSSAGRAALSLSWRLIIATGPHTESATLPMAITMLPCSISNRGSERQLGGS